MPGCSPDNERLYSIITREYSSLRKAAKAMGISHSHLSKVLRGKREPGRKFIDGFLATFREVKFEEIFLK